jgi:hypothetical protein
MATDTLLVAFHEASQPEVQDLHEAVRAHHDVLGLDVSMHDPRRVCHAERQCNLAYQL